MSRHRTASAPRVPSRTRGAVLAAVLGTGLLVGGLDLVLRDPAVEVSAIAAETAPSAPAAARAAVPAPAADAAARADPLALRLPTVPEPAHETTGGSSTAVAGQPRSVDDAEEARLASPPPTTLSFPAAQVTADVVPVGVLPTGALQLPDDPATVGWWSAGALPGEDAGTVVVAGHVDSQDEVGVLSLLPDLTSGDVVTVGTDGGAPEHAYRVVSRESAPKAALDPALFARGGPHLLALITCGGRFDAQAGAYDDNVIVLAEPVSGGAPAG